MAKKRAAQICIMTVTASLEEGYITITVLARDMTDHRKTHELEKHLGEITL
jgi:hypothetical protein